MPAGMELDDRMVSAGGAANAPWHYSFTKDRTTLVEAESINWSEILAQAGLDWQVARGQMYFKSEGGELVEAPGHYATYRTDNQKFLGVVSGDYQEIQNSDVRDFLMGVVKEANADFVTAGSLHGNRVVWLLMKLPEHVNVGGMEDERLDLYLLGTTGHGGLYGRDLRSFQVCPTTVRVVCTNTLSWAIGGARNLYTIRHAGDVQQHLTEAREALKISFKFQEDITALANRLVQETYNEKELTEFLKKLCPEIKSRDADPALKARRHIWAQNKRREILEVLTQTDDLAPIRDTRYGLLQAVSAFESHHRRFVGSDETPAEERRFAVTMGLTRQDSFTTRAAKILAAPTFGSAKVDADIAEILTDF